MLKVEVITNVAEKVDTYIVDTPDSATKLADAMFEATGNTTKVIDPIGNIIHERITPKNAFLALSKKEQEDKLMETSMRIMDLYTGLYTDFTDYMSMLSTFTSWAREYEYANYGKENYEAFWLEDTEKYFTPMLKEEFGGDR